MKTPFKKGEIVLVSPQVTGKNDWQEGVIIDIEENPFAGIVITVEIDGETFFEKQDMFKIAENEVCTP